MNLQILSENIQGVDIYILDQILKGRYNSSTKILDAGCGSGRNLKWFYNNNYEVYGIDVKSDSIKKCKEIYAKQANHFTEAPLEEIPFEANSFDHVICNAVLHFAKDLSHYLEMFSELLRILKPGGSLFIRTASNFGMEKQVEHVNNGIYKLPDGSTRFLLTDEILAHIQKKFNFSLLEDVKTTIVRNKRCMTTLVMKANK